MIKIEGLTKRYAKGSAAAVDNATLNIEEGKIYGLLGRNGAGKTTLINLITNRLLPSEGSVTIDGMAAQENDNAQEKIFCMTEKGSYPADLRVCDCFYWAAQFYKGFDRKYAEELSKEFELDINKRLRALSTGYGSITKLIMTLASNAPYLVFDEPTLGLDAGMRELFYRKLLERYSETGGTYIMSSHYIVEIADLLEKVIIIDNGKIIINEDKEELVGSAYIISGTAKVAEAFAEGRKVLHRRHMGGFTSITIDEKLTSSARKEAEAVGLDVSGAELQDIFVKLTEKESVK